MSRLCNKIFTIITLCTAFSSLSVAGPWFTGPILAPAGHTIPRGRSNLEVYALDVQTTGQFTNTRALKHIPLFNSYLINPLLSHGFTDFFDVQLALPYVFNSTQHHHYNRLSDVGVGFGFQIFEQKNAKNLPDFRFFIQETFPTGKFESLQPLLLGADATGLGSYRTLLGFNFQYLSEPFENHYLRTRLILSELISSQVHVVGINAFGGTVNTEGIVNPGNQENIDLAFEFTLTQNWVAVMEGYYSKGQATHFNGILDLVSEGSTAILQNDFYEYGLAPAIEYNFNANVGLIGGVWFPLRGKNTSEFTTYVLAINAFW